MVGIREICSKGSRIAAVLIVSLLIGCDTNDSTTTPTADKVPVSLALCVSPSQQSASATTRQGSTAVQSAESLASYRGITDIRLIPFDVQGTIGKDDEPAMRSINMIERQGTTTNYLAQDVELSIGTASFLGYAKAPELDKPTDMSDDKYFSNGKLDACDAFTNNTFTTPSDITFNLRQIYPSTKADEKASDLAVYMTHIAKATGWRTSTSGVLKSLYEGFTGGGKLMAGSSANIEALLTKLYGDLVKDNWTSDDRASVIEAITIAISEKATIDNNTVKLNSDISGYPANLKLPDGSAAIQWHTALKKKEGGVEGEMEEDPDASGFVAITHSGSGQDLSDQTRFTYPAELYYYANSRIKTSISSQASHYSLASWADVLGYYDSDDGVVTTTTRSVALTDQMNYGVACLELQIQATGLKDATGDYLVDNGSEKVYLGNSNFPLTGVFVGGQYPVDYSFQTGDGTTDEDLLNERIIYDKAVVPGIHLTTDQSSANYTLVLQSKLHKSVNIVLEFSNESNKSFKGSEGGIIYPGTHFYLVGKVIPSTTATDPIENQRVFTRDHKTVVTMTVKSLMNAYNVIPDLKTAQHDLEVTSVGVRQWNDRPGTDKNLYNW